MTSHPRSVDPPRNDAAPGGETGGQKMRRGGRSTSSLLQLVDHVAHFQHRVLQDALAEATAAYWTRRAEAFSQVGTQRCDEIAQACRNRAALAIGEDTPDAVTCQTCGTPTSPWTCSCGTTRLQVVA